ncbi:phycobiliprotein lyase [Prochlorothrix hollandica]|uniref:Chromophore lyase CpcS/CpeS n=1 Tax=Prochlorothrix hollandica PCC 9006 = CALU 1027 TaxID=317619 RepID=A0A0M2PXK4_PROHO|nr:phycobiliprotein lyase [Prochlorothrix hollandica]KKJ00895.1 chorismate-binding protein [Prochlorothrix hollandica PCC 9006 = CALU 1027]
MNALDFFHRSAGQWRSRRTTHHLALRRAETGSSLITVESLGSEDDRIRGICQFHGIDPNLALGGAFISWKGSMEWDQSSESHQGTSVFALVPDAPAADTGRLLRDQGYGEMMPVVGRYHMATGDRLLLSTDYETLSATEEFWFANPQLRLRVSTVKRLGGFVNSSFCTETRLDSQHPACSLEAPSDFPPSAIGW